MSNKIINIGLSSQYRNKELLCAVAKDSSYMENVYIVRKTYFSKEQRAKTIALILSPFLKWRGKREGWGRHAQFKKIVLTAAIFFTVHAAVYAETKTDVSVRSSSQDGVVRLVFEAEDAFIKKTDVSTSDMQVIVEFPSAFNLIRQKGFDLETSIKDRALTIKFKEPFEMKILRLSLPSRLVADIAALKSASDKTPQQEIVLRQKVFVFDPGHGGYDSGIASDELKEKDIALSIAKEIEGLLIKKAKSVYLTRRSDQLMLLKDRAIFANQKMPEIFLSVHVSASENFVLYTSKIAETGSEPSQAEIYGLKSRQKKYAQKSRMLAESIGKAVKEEFNLNVVQREMPLPVLDYLAAPAVLIEVPSFKNMGYDQKTRIRLAEAIMKGFFYYGE